MKKITEKTGHFLDIAECFVNAVLVILLGFTFLFRTVTVRGHSMENTLFQGDRAVVSTFFYSAKAGDIAVINSDVLEETIIKRIIAVGNSKVVIDTNKNLVIVDGKILDEKYIKERFFENEENFSADFFQSETGVYQYDVPFGYVFVMGDNRNNSTDSRMIGIVSKDEIVGKVTYRFYSEKGKNGKVC